METQAIKRKSVLANFAARIRKFFRRKPTSWDFRRTGSTKVPERLFVYIDGLCDDGDGNTAVKIEYISRPELHFSGLDMRFDVVHSIRCSDTLFENIQEAWLKQKWIKVAAMLSTSGRLVKTEGRIVALKIEDNTRDFAVMSYSILCQAEPFV
jgi:hypothetical protein